MKKRIFCLLLLMLIPLSVHADLPAATASDFSVASIFTDNMVLQRDREIRIWGTSKDEGATLYVKLDDQIAFATVQGGVWEAVLPPQAACNEPKVLEICGSAEASHFFLENIVIGDVWWVLGQSNVEYSATSMVEWLTVRDTLPSSARVITYNSDDISDTEAEEGFSASERRYWRPLTSYSAAQSSALGVCLVRDIAKKIETDIPLGLISMGFRGQDLAMFVPPHIAEDMTAAGKKSEIYNRVIRSMEHLPVRGLVWYQGEANGPTYAEYNKKFTAFITHLRDNMGHFPVYIIELAPCFPPSAQDSEWQYLDFGIVRGEMGTLPMQTEDVYMISTSDLWTSRTYKNSLHPPNKMAVANRAANAILTNAYKLWDEEMALSPTVSKVNYGETKNEVYVTFSHVGDGLITTEKSGNQVLGFSAIDRKWNPISSLSAQLISRDTIHIVCDREICILQYGCRTDDVFPETVSLASSHFLPAAAFRTILSEPDNAPFYVVLYQYGYAFCKNYWPYILVAVFSLFLIVLFGVIRKKKTRKS